MSNFRQAFMGSMLYAGDYEDRMVLSSQQPGPPGNSSNDRTWVQLVLPYLREFGIFKCPSDYGKRPSAEASFDEDLVPGDTDSRYYSASKRSNIGYNYLYLAPLFTDGRGKWFSTSHGLGEVYDPSRTILFVDSVWDVNASGFPYGGGSWLVLPPCRYLRQDGRKIDTFGLDTADRIYAPKHASGWRPDKQLTAEEFGFAWPWHEGTMNVIRLDGHAKSMTPRQLGSGCDVRDRWTGDIRDSANYDWDLN